MRLLTAFMAILLPLSLIEGSASEGPRGQSFLKITHIEPTVLFKKDQNGLMQAVDIAIENKGQAMDGRLTVKSRSNKDLIVNLGIIEPGNGNYRFFIPEIPESIPVEFLLETTGKTAESFTVDWTPRKHWEVCLIPISHHDLGYTHSIENVLEKYIGIYEDVLRFCEETEDYPDEAKFRYSVEGAWSLQYFIEKSDKEKLEKLAKYMKEGRVEVQALIGNEITNLCGHEELIRLMYPSFRIKREFGGKISVGSITDVTGLSWGLPIALSNSGVDYFFAGLPNYLDWWSEKFSYMRPFWDEENILRPHGKPDAFYWKGRDICSLIND